MIQFLVMALLIIGSAIYFGGVIWSGVLAYRIKKWGYLISLFIIGPISYPFFTIIYRKEAATNFRMFCVALLLIALAFVPAIIMSLLA